MIDLKRLFAKMTENGYFYFSGLTNSNGEFDITFSTLHDGRGNMVHIVMNIDQKYDLNIDVDHCSKDTINLSEKEISILLDMYVFVK